MMQERAFFKLPIWAVIVGGLLRAWLVGSKSLWLDEALLLVRLEKSLAEMIAGQSELYHPPLYYELMRGWIALFGASEVALRLPSVLLGTAALPVFYLLARAVLTRPQAVTALWLAALSPLLIWYGQEARSYGIMIFLYVLSGLALVRGGAAGRRGGAAGWWLLLGLVQAAALYLHYAAVLLIPVQLLLLTILLAQGRVERTSFAFLAASWVVAGLAFLPWWRTPAMGRFVDILGSDRFYLAQTFSELTGLSYVQAFEVMGVGGLVAAAGGLAAVYGLLRRWGSELGALAGRPAVGWGAAVLFLLLLAALVFPRAYSLKRQLAPLFPFFLLAAGWLWPMRRPLLRRSGGLALVLAGSLAAALVSVAFVPKADWRAAVDVITAGAAEGDVVVIYPPYLDIPFGYYDSGGALETVRLSGPPEEALPLLLADHERIWWIEHRIDQAGGGAPLERWLEENLRPAGEQGVYLLDIRLFEKPAGGGTD